MPFSAENPPGRPALASCSYQFDLLPATCAKEIPHCKAREASGFLIDMFFDRFLGTDSLQGKGSQVDGAIFTIGYELAYSIAGRR
jgi:hypothetical protein